MWNYIVVWWYTALALFHTTVIAWIVLSSLLTGCFLYCANACAKHGPNGGFGRLRLLRAFYQSVVNNDHQGLVQIIMHPLGFPQPPSQPPARAPMSYSGVSPVNFGGFAQFVPARRTQPMRRVENMADLEERLHAVGYERRIDDSSADSGADLGAQPPPYVAPEASGTTAPPHPQAPPMPAVIGGGRRRIFSRPSAGSNGGGGGDGEGSVASAESE
jgi:hypothetical protein